MAALFYNTNGFPFHRLEDVVAILAELGYDGIALTPDVHHLDPLRTGPDAWRRERERIEAAGLDVIVETGARFVLDARTKHRPSLLDDPPGDARRLDFLFRVIDQAAVLGAPVISTWSGNGPEGLDPGQAFDRLVAGLRRLCAYAADHGVRVGFEPEPGMLVEAARDWPRVREAVDHAGLGLTLDVGHCLAVEDLSPEQAIRAFADDLLVLQLDDHRRGRHDHLAFGEGEVDFEAVARAVRDVGFQGPLEVELSRHGSEAPRVAAASLAFLRAHFDNP
ncbi:MAG: sugar phosphate isomerase/epimerase family protein [Planctomycetota bacterium]